tara:strand:- start:67320 stop:68984 length:1665 start_codon:yes stop_codon:yes gene_type:complete
MFKKEIINILKTITGIKEKELNNLIEIPQNKQHGDYSFPCYILAKKLNKNPNEIAKSLVSKIKSNHIEKLQVIGAYLNFFINKTLLTEKTIYEVLKLKNKYGSTNLGKGKKYLVEHTSVNPNASPHVGRARNALIGDAIVRILRFQNYKIETHYFVNDVGKQIAMLVLASKSKKNIKFNDLLGIYIKINKELEKDKQKEKKIFDLLRELEQGNQQVRSKFKKTVDICVKGQLKIFKELGMNYDYIDYESKYLWNRDTNFILKKLEKTKRLFNDEHKRKVLDQKEYKLAMKSPVLVLTRANGTSLYPLRDIAYTIEKVRKTPNNLIILGEDQKLYFQQIKAVLHLLKFPCPNVIHYSFILLKEGKMSTRKGNLVLLEEFMEEARKKAHEEIKKRKNKITKNLDKIIGYGALKFSILKIAPEKNIVFEWEQALNFEGETSPYIQYAHARICSILKKIKAPRKVDLSNLYNQYELDLITLISNFPNVVNESVKHLKPSLIANYLIDISKSFNSFYASVHVINAEPHIRDARILLISAVRQVLENGLSLLGIEAPQEM